MARHYVLSIDDPPAEAAADYFVDPAAGLDSNTGTSTGAAWKNLPGTRNSGNTAYLNTHSISAGDIIEIKAGSSFTSTTSGYILINSTYYANGTSGSPIVIRTSKTWGSGNVSYNLTGITIPQYFGGWHILREYIHLIGHVDSLLQIHSGSNANGFNVEYYGVIVSVDGPKMEYLDCYGHSYANGGAGPAADGIMNNCSWRDATGSGSGFQFGLADDQTCANWFITDSSFNDNAPTYHTADNTLPHGAHCVGDHTLTFTRCQANGCGRDGFDMGIATGTGLTATINLIDCESVSNGEDGIGCNNQAGAPANTVTVNVVNHRFWGNNNGMQIYDGVTANVYHSVFYNQSRGLYVYCGDASLTTTAYVRNCIFDECGTAQFAVIDTFTSAGTVDIDVDYCLWKPRSADSEKLFEHFGGSSYDYTQNPNSDSWMTWGTNNTKGTTTTINFTAESTTVYANCDFHVSATTDAENAGLYISSPTAAQTDLDSASRSDPPEIGLYEI